MSSTFTFLFVRVLVCQKMLRWGHPLLIFFIQIIFIWIHNDSQSCLALFLSIKWKYFEDNFINQIKIASTSLHQINKTFNSEQFNSELPFCGPGIPLAAEHGWVWTCVERHLVITLSCSCSEYISLLFLIIIHFLWRCLSKHPRSPYME